MSVIKIAENIYWVGVVDWTVRNFHGHTYNTNRGTTYNAYLIMDEKVTLVDTVYGPFAKELIENVRQVTDPSKIDYIVVNHVETDHSGALPEVWKLCQKAKLFGTQKCKEGLYKNYYVDWDFNVVKSGETLNLGKRTLTFLEAPMLHWPDSMFTYIKEDALLMPNDAFGQHYATSARFDDEVDQAVLMEEAIKYYANILWPLSSLVLKKIEEVVKMNIPIKTIAPSHGIIWRKDPGKIINAYVKWAKNETEKKVVVVYETMWNSTEKMARKIVEGLSDSGCDVRLYDINKADITAIIGEMLNAKGVLIGSSTHDNDTLTNIAGFLEFFKGLKPKNRIGASFGSYGWAGGAAKNIEGRLKEAGLEIAMPFLQFKFVPDIGEFKQCYEFGKAFAEKINNSDKV
ncbi:MAG: flavodoxin domain-containing protein [Elusimicrobia bacterium]|nr:flavodoxin domain-containing protein [Candidatus Liberimonas magnetica]